MLIVVFLAQLCGILVPTSYWGESVVRGFWVAAFAVMCSCIPAHADQAFDVVEAVCSSDVDYASITFRKVWDIDPRQATRSSDLAVGEAASALRKPFECRLREHVLRVVVGFRDRKPVGSHCVSGDGDAFLDVSLDGVSLACLQSFPDADVRQRLTITRDPFGGPHKGSIMIEQCRAELKPVDRDTKILADQGTLRCVTTFPAPSKAMPRDRQ